jgi:hypothetical protein
MFITRLMFWKFATRLKEKRMMQAMRIHRGLMTTMCIQALGEVLSQRGIGCEVFFSSLPDKYTALYMFNGVRSKRISMASHAPKKRPMAFGAHDSVAALICLVGLVPYLVMALHGSVIAVAIFVNGVLFHGSKLVKPSCTAVTMQWDVAWNVAFGSYVVATTTWQPQTFQIASVSAVSFLINNYALAETRPIAGGVYHVIAVQWPMAMGLWMFDR